MAVYTRLDPDEVQVLLFRYGLGRLEGLEPIAEGIENTNYRVGAGGRTFVATLFEREPAGEAETTLRLMGDLAARGTPCPAPLMSDGGPLVTLRGKPAALVPFVEGEVAWMPTEARLESLGGAIARLHRAGIGLTYRRDGPQLERVLVPLARGMAGRLQSSRADLADLLRAEADYQETVREEGLPAGIIHSDLFRDNVLFAPGGTEVRAFLDFYLWGTGPWIYDLAVVLVDACWGEQGVVGDRARAVLRGYRPVRPLEGREYEVLPAYLRRAALRFLCLRVERTYLSPSPMSAGERKDPMVFARRLRLLRQGRVEVDR